MQTIGVSLYDPARAWKFSSSIMTVFSLDVMNQATNAIPVESDNYFFPSVPRVVMDQVRNADYYYSVPYKTNYARFQVLWQTDSPSTNFTNVYLNVPIEPAVVLPLQTFQVWLRVHYCECYTTDGINNTDLDSINYIKQVSNGSHYFTSITSQTDQAGNVWQCFEFKNTTSETINFSGLTIFFQNDHPVTIYDTYGFVSVSLELGPMLLGFVSGDSNSIKSQQFWNDAYFLGIENDYNQLQSLYAERVFGSDPEYDSPYDGLEVPEYNIDEIIKEDEALGQADEDLDKFLDDVDGSDVQNCVDFFQYVFGKINAFAEVAVITGGTIVVSIFRAVMGR